MKQEYKDYKLTEGRVLRVIRDTCPESPDKWGNEDIFLVYDHRQFNVRRNGFDPVDIFDHLQETGTNDKFDDYYIFPVDAYIHSGIHLSLANTKNYPDRRWDVSTTGYILVKKKNELLQGIEFVTEDKAKEYAKGLIETWNQYLSGDIWGFELLKSYKTYTITEEDFNNLMKSNKTTINWYEDKFKELAQENIEYEEEDSCYGFYGDDPKINGMLDHIKYKLLDDEEDN